MKIIIDATNLLGDSIYCIQAILQACKQNKDIKAVVAHPGLAYEMFKRVLSSDVAFYIWLVDSINEALEFNPEATVLRLSAGQAADLSYQHHQAHPETRQMHITQAYAVLLGIDLKGDIAPPKSISHNVIKERTFLAVSPFSRSCSRHTNETPNKTLDDWKWEYIIRYLRRQGLPVKVIAGPGDSLKNCSVPVNDYFTAKSFDELEDFLAQCKLLISVDNGLGHIASFLETPMISLWPKVSNMTFIGPCFGHKTAFITMEPNTAMPAQLLQGIKHFARMILTGEPQIETLIE